jgi:hypothetical protein
MGDCTRPRLYLSRHGPKLGIDLKVSNIQATLLWGLLFSSIGLGFFVYGRKQKAVVPLVCGLALIVFPYFVSNVTLLVGMGALLVAVPFFLRL